MVLPLPKYIFITSRVKDVIEENALSGATIKPIGTLAFPSEVIDEIAPGRLSYYMPDSRARDLGESLGIY